MHNLCAGTFSVRNCRLYLTGNGSIHVIHTTLRKWFAVRWVWKWVFPLFWHECFLCFDMIVSFISTWVFPLFRHECVLCFDMSVSFVSTWLCPLLRHECLLCSDCLATSACAISYHRYIRHCLRDSASTLSYRITFTMTCCLCCTASPFSSMPCCLCCTASPSHCRVASAVPALVGDSALPSPYSNVFAPWYRFCYSALFLQFSP